MQPTMTAAQKERGQGFAEFALILPILLFMIFVIIDMGRVLTTYAMASNNLRDALRQAEVLGYENVAGVAPYEDCDAMRSRLRQVFFLQIPEGAYTIHFYDDADGNTATDVVEDVVLYNGCDSDAVSAYAGADDLENGDILEITVNADVALLTPAVSSLIPEFPIRLTGQRTILTEIELQGDPQECLDIVGPVDPSQLGDEYYDLTSPTTGEDYDCDTDYDGLNDFWEDYWFGDRSGTIETSDLDEPASADEDGDGCNNGCEESRNGDPTSPDNTSQDTDGDGLTDGEESEGVEGPDGTIWYTFPDKADSDEDGINDYDEIFGTESPINPGTFYYTNPLVKDTDKDRNDPLLNPTGLTDYEEIFGVVSPFDGLTYYTDPDDQDSDNDGLNDYDEIHAQATDPNDENTDGDNYIDGDEITNGWDPLDICDPEETFPPCDPDDDGLTNEQEATLGTDPNNPDTDDDTLEDGDENGTSDPLDPCNPNLSAGACDQDTDGLTNSEEAGIGTDPTNPNSDLDTASPARTDGDEVANGTDPLDCADPAPECPALIDNDGDGVYADHPVPAQRDPDDADPCNPNETAGPCDQDGDGLTNDQEIAGGSDPVNPCDPTAGAACDADSDGLPYPDEINAGSNPNVADTDGDGVNDGADGTLGSTATNPCLPSNTVGPCDRDSDGLTNAQEITAGSIQTDPDSDDDGLNDGPEWTWKTTYACLSLTDNDSDNDGWTDGQEITTYSMNPCVVSSPSDISINDVSVTEGDSGTLNMTFTVTVSPANVSALTINYATSNGTAIAGTDYNAASGVLNIPANDGSEPITVQIRGDLLDELSESFTLTLSGASVGTITDGTATGTITDNDLTPTVSVADVAVAENAGTATVTITLSAASGQNVSVNYATANGTAIAGTNYTAASGSRTINAGSLTATFNVTIIDNITVGDKTFFVNLTSPVNATISDAQAVVTITDDDNVDSDNDGLINNAETDTYLTLPNDRDTDNDLLTDGEEVLTYGTSPTTATSQITGRSSPAVETFLAAYIENNSVSTGITSAQTGGFLTDSNNRVQIQLTLKNAGNRNSIEALILSSTIGGANISGTGKDLIAYIPINKITTLLMYNSGGLNVNDEVEAEGVVKP